MLGDTIQAVSSPPGSGPRAVLRLSGPQALDAASAVFRPPLPRERAQVEGTLAPALGALPALALVMPGPHSYTGEDVVELHLPGSPLLLAEVQRAMATAVGSGLRPARPGEFTARACRNGRLDLLQAEGVLLLIHGQDLAATAAGAAWLAGGLSAAVARVRGLLQDALALVEVGLDFEAGDTGEVPVGLWLPPLDAAASLLRALHAGLPVATRGGEVLLLGRANAGKSSLCNALSGREAVLVDADAGTTRDLVRVEVADGTAVWDAPGDLDAPGDADRLALAVRDRLGAQAASALWVVDPTDPVLPVGQVPPVLALVATKADAVPVASVGELLRQPALPGDLPRFVVSARSGQGIAELRAFLREHSGDGARDAGAPVRDAIERALAALGRARHASEQPELAGADLHAALSTLGEIDGAHGVDDLLDRIYGRFCLGK